MPSRPSRHPVHHPHRSRRGRALREDGPQCRTVRRSRSSGPCSRVPSQQSPSMSQETRTMATPLVRGRGSFFKNCRCTRQNRCAHPCAVRYRGGTGRQREQTGFTTQQDALDRPTKVCNEKRHTPERQAASQRETGRHRFGPYAGCLPSRRRSGRLEDEGPGLRPALHVVFHCWAHRSRSVTSNSSSPPKQYSGMPCLRGALRTDQTVVPQSADDHPGTICDTMTASRSAIVCTS